ncbi:hypothetical protein EBL_c09120 [Shimwellia blattae DSM 4481 = NBRC 105725]|uniref:Uncharacterized protein n=1 Tax=Shimwellia blattae (strain ATCC 29907 / DSM 4481 / JCM 1650 / NBRC 105725 / CDC 9005-74) TaxID=630626 RepID=I2B673_SHIBC|nr:hypothetical protein EBL_c09120 [Shimwellia blattae DSM 4481 = NBRC 105725]
MLGYMASVIFHQDDKYIDKYRK